MNLIVAFNNNNVIGNDNKIPWYIPEDLKLFQKTTKNNIIVMGRKTFESLPNGPLKNRINIVITNQRELYDKNNETLIYTNFSDSFELLKNLQRETQKEIFIIGGNTIYSQYFEYCTKFHISLINNEQHGDTIFPYNIQYFHKNFHLLHNETLFTSTNENFTYHIFEKRNVL